MKAWLLASAVALPFLAIAAPALADDRSEACSNASVKGRYGLTTHGVVVGVYDKADPAPLAIHYYEPGKTPLRVDIISDETYDGRGHSTFSYLGFSNGTKFSTSELGEDFNREPGVTGTYSVNKDCTGFVEVTFPPAPPPSSAGNAFTFHRAFVLSNDGKTLHMLWTDVHFVAIAQRLLPDGVTCRLADGGCDLAVQVYTDGERY